MCASPGVKLIMVFAKNCKRSGNWELRGGRRYTEKRLGHEQGQAENVRPESSDFLEEMEFGRRN